MSSNMNDFFVRENNHRRFGLDGCRIFQVRRGRACPPGSRFEVSKCCGYTVSLRVVKRIA
jgi:hypothetical protein